MSITLILAQALILLGLSIPILTLLRRWHLPPVLGYLCIGLLLFPYIEAWTALEPLAEIGLVLLLFTIGLEFSLPRLRGLYAELLWLGGTQVLISTLSGLVIALWIGIPWQGALVLGGAMAMSSTAIVLSQLNEQLELRRPHGRLAFAVLLFQDLTAVLFLALIPAFAGLDGTFNLQLLLETMLKGILAVGLVLASAHWLMRPMLEIVARARSSEIFTLSALFVSLAAAWLTHVNGISAALGALLAGMLFSGTKYRHQIEHDLRPFRDVLMGVFFISIGLRLDAGQVLNYWPWLCLLLPGIVLGKGALITVLALIYRHPPATALRLGTVLGQGGELGLALIFLALKYGVVTGADGQPIIAAIILSMLCAPLLVRHNDFPERLWLKYFRGTGPPPPRAATPAPEITETGGNGHVLLCGFGHVGQNVAGILRRGGVPYRVLELNPEIVQEAQQAGEPVWFGDSTRLPLLRTAGLDGARALAVTYRDFELVRETVRQVRRHRPELPILARGVSDREIEELVELGVRNAVPEHVETGTLLATHLLREFGTTPRRMWELLEECSKDGYRGLRAFFQTGTDLALNEADFPSLQSLRLSADSPAAGRPLAELLPADSPVRVRALRRAGSRIDSPAPEQRLQAGDILLLEGDERALEEIEAKLAGTLEG